ncbi:DUF302 domain-containing protein [Pontibacter sp. E15-1]|uniref:DUF302 domain-containing protein n=1 Tax=Pontibacter sp. E15-1 TaxID=2919918 RepID=UPI001F4FC125|nr:DUF302 domain-containing protein [Pontibacter sp. E15-1]MCJ8164365.1 DUF302 domain-containing protein [Pontibacter sp. E15-1]
MNYNFTKKVDYTFQEALEKTKEALKAEGFGVISEIDLKEKFKEKLDLDFREYMILGACNPALAHKAIEQEDKIGTMLPCNVLVQEHAGGNVEVTAINPMESMSSVGNDNLTEVAKEVSEKLKTALDKL